MKKLSLTILAATFILACCCVPSSFADEAEVSDCGPWVNCNHNSPAFDGYCCRICYFEELGYREWECAEHTYDVGLSDEDKQKIRKRFLYNGVNKDIREMLIVELNTEKPNE